MALRRHALGLTLIEVLVTCAILSILASLIYPVVGKAVMSGKETRTKNNLRQIYVGLMLYRELYDSKVEFGSTIDMGLPFNMPLKEGALAVVPNTETWRSPCCCHPQAPTGYPTYDFYYIDYGDYFDGDSAIWELYVKRFEGNAALVFDMHCNPADVDVDHPRSQVVKAIGVYLNGKIQTLSRNSISPSQLEYFWNY